MQHLQLAGSYIDPWLAESIVGLRVPHPREYWELKDKRVIGAVAGSPVSCI